MIKSFGLGIVSILLIIPLIDHPDEASLGGRITDHKLVGIAEAKISASHVISGEGEYVISDARGFYKVTGLRQGRYSVFVKAEGYCSKSIFNVVLFRGEHTTLNVALTGSREGIPTANC